MLPDRLKEALTLTGKCRDAKELSKCLKIIIWELQKLVSASKKAIDAKKAIAAKSAKTAKKTVVKSVKKAAKKSIIPSLFNKAK